MTPEEVNNFANILVLTAAMPALGYTITYGVGSPWYRSPLGSVMFGLGVSLTVVFGVVIGRRLFGAYPGYEWVAIVAYSLVTAALWSLWAIVLIERRRATPVLSFPLSKRKATPMTHVEISTATVPEIWFKTKRAVRTIVQTLVVLVPIANAIAAAVIGYLNDQTDVAVPAWVFIALNGIVVATALLAGLVARIMAVPGVNAWLVRIGLGSVPAAAIESGKV